MPPCHSCSMGKAYRGSPGPEYLYLPFSNDMRSVGHPVRCEQGTEGPAGQFAGQRDMESGPVVCLEDGMMRLREFRFVDDVNAPSRVLPDLTGFTWEQTPDTRERRRQKSRSERGSEEGKWAFINEEEETGEEDRGLHAAGGALSSVHYFNRRIDSAHFCPEGEQVGSRTPGVRHTFTTQEHTDGTAALQLGGSGSPLSTCHDSRCDWGQFHAKEFRPSSFVGVESSSESPAGSFSVSPSRGALPGASYASFYHPTCSTVCAAEELAYRFRRNPASFFLINPPLFFAPRFASRHFASLVLYEGYPHSTTVVGSAPASLPESMTLYASYGGACQRSRLQMAISDPHDWSNDVPFRREEKGKNEEKEERPSSKRHRLHASHLRLFAGCRRPVRLHSHGARGDGASFCDRKLFADLPEPVHDCACLQPVRRLHPSFRSTLVAPDVERRTTFSRPLPSGDLHAQQRRRGSAEFFSRDEDRRFLEGTGSLTAILSNLLAAYGENGWTDSSRFVGRLHKVLGVLKGLDNFTGSENSEVSALPDAVSFMPTGQMEKLLLTEERRLAVLEELSLLLVERLEGLPRLGVQTGGSKERERRLSCISNSRRVSRLQESPSGRGTDRSERRTNSSAVRRSTPPAVRIRSVLSERAVSRKRSDTQRGPQRESNSPAPGVFESRPLACCTDEARDLLFRSGDKRELGAVGTFPRAIQRTGSGRRRTLEAGTYLDPQGEARSGETKLAGEREGDSTCTYTHSGTRGQAAEERFHRETPLVSRTGPPQTEEPDRRTADGFSDRSRTAWQQKKRQTRFHDSLFTEGLLTQSFGPRRGGGTVVVFATDRTGRENEHASAAGSSGPIHGGVLRDREGFLPPQSPESMRLAASAKENSLFATGPYTAVPVEVCSTVPEPQGAAHRGGAGQGDASRGRPVPRPARCSPVVTAFPETCHGHWGVGGGDRGEGLFVDSRTERLGLEGTANGSAVFPSLGGARQINHVVVEAVRDCFVENTSHAGAPEHLPADSYRMTTASSRGGERDTVMLECGGEHRLGEAGACGTGCLEHFQEQASRVFFRNNDIHPDEVLFFRGSDDLEDTASLFTWTRQWRAYEEEEDAATRYASLPPGEVLSQERPCICGDADQARMYPPHRYGFYSLVRHQETDLWGSCNEADSAVADTNAADNDQVFRVMGDRESHNSGHFVPDNTDGGGLAGPEWRGIVGTDQVFVPDLSALGRPGAAALAETEMTGSRDGEFVPTADQGTATAQQIDRGTEGDSFVIAQEDQSSSLPGGQQEEAVPVAESPVRRPARRSYAEVVLGGTSASGGFLLQEETTAFAQDGEAGDLGDDHEPNVVGDVDLAPSRSGRRQHRFSSSVTATEMYTFLQVLLECLASYTPSRHIRPPRLRRHYRGDDGSVASSSDTDSSSSLDDDEGRSQDEDNATEDERRREFFVSSLFLIPDRTLFGGGDVRNRRSSSHSSDSSRRRRRRQEDLRRVVGVGRSVRAPLEALVQHTRTLLGRWRRLLAVKRRHTRERMEAEEAEATLNDSLVFSNGCGCPVVDGAVRQRWRRHEARCEREEANLREQSLGLMEFWSFLRGFSEGE